MKEERYNLSNRLKLAKIERQLVILVTVNRLLLLLILAIRYLMAE